MNKSGKDKERRRSPRYETDVQIKFRVNFDVQTRVDYRLRDQDSGEPAPERYQGVSQNVSLEGMCFYSQTELQPGDRLLMEVFVPAANEPIPMEAEVRWCRVRAPRHDDHEHDYQTGVKVVTVKGEEVARTIFQDPVHHMMWSNLLEEVFSSFKELSLKRKGAAHSAG